MVGGLGGCCGTIRPRLVGPLWCSEMSPAERNDMMPVPSPQFGWAVVKQTRPPWKNNTNSLRRMKKKPTKERFIYYNNTLSMKGSSFRCDTILRGMCKLL